MIYNVTLPTVVAVGLMKIAHTLDSDISFIPRKCIRFLEESGLNHRAQLVQNNLFMDCIVHVL